MKSTFELVRPPRPLTGWEAAVVGRLAPADLHAHISALRVYERCTCGCASVSFEREDEAHWPGAELEAYDTDGTEIGLILFTDGAGTAMHYLEVLRLDGQPIRALPDPAELQLPADIRHPPSPGEPGAHFVWGDKGGRQRGSGRG